MCSKKLDDLVAGRHLAFINRQASAGKAWGASSTWYSWGLILICVVCGATSRVRLRPATQHDKRLNATTAMIDCDSMWEFFIDMSHIIDGACGARTFDFP